MKGNLKSEKSRWLLCLISLFIFSLGTLSVYAADDSEKTTAETETQEVKDDTIDLSAFQSDGIFCYKNIPWGSTLEELQELWDGEIISAETLDNTAMGMYFGEGRLEGKLARAQFGFVNHGLTDLSFWFRSDKNVTEEELAELTDHAVERFKELYGECTEEEYESKIPEMSGTKIKSYLWREPDTENVNTALEVQCTYRFDGEMTDLLIGASSISLQKEARSSLERE